MSRPQAQASKGTSSRNEGGHPAIISRQLRYGLIFIPFAWSE